MVPDIKSANQTCYRCNVKTADIDRLGLADWAADPAIQFWGGFPTDEYVIYIYRTECGSTLLLFSLSMYYKIVMSPCAGGEVCLLILPLLFLTRELTGLPLFSRLCHSTAL